MPDELPPATVRSSLDASVGVTVQCKACGHSGPLDLDDVAARGHADTPLLALPLRCRCGASRFGVTVSGRQRADTKKAPGQCPGD